MERWREQLITVGCWPDVGSADENTRDEVLHQTQEVLVPQEQKPVHVGMQTLDLILPEHSHL